MGQPFSEAEPVENAGRFLFGRLINRDEERLQILPLDAGGR